jgi:hypothetical protein
MDTLLNIDFTIFDEYDSNSEESYYNYAHIGFEKLENVDTDYFSVHVSC